ncbi:hypothetical protein Pint_34997 [Pistacia integerrima]|uniref:Uncharacterized protein n=1 Tax=Pistacia integerrima TaxID=434235 RepID=A0ACC0Y361_9ROSI|nr:hypothetical protein Pint_34997 [Pistacia integerrima]
MAHFAYTSPPVANPFSIISPQFCAHTYLVELAIVKKVKTITDGKFVVQDMNVNIHFKLKIKKSSSGRVLINSAGNPIVTPREKILTAHERWQVFRGDSTGSRNLIFSVKRSSMLQSITKPKLTVFLANNTEENVCDFKVTGNGLERSSVIYAGESSIVVAQLHMKQIAQNLLNGKGSFMVRVNPNVDYAFIVSLIVILDAIYSGVSNEDEDDDHDHVFLDLVLGVFGIPG